MSRPRILVTGAHGQLGRALAARSADFDADWIFLTRTDLDISDSQAITTYFASNRFDYCINTAAYTQVDKAEDESALARAINAEAPGIMSQICAKQNCVFIHFSTDYVYDNGLTRPLLETDPLSPTSVYARTKLAGEVAALEANPQSIIIRTSWVFSEYGSNFVKTMARLMTQGKSLKVVNDQTGCPTYAGDLAQAVISIVGSLTRNETSDLYDIYNFCNDGPVTWYDFALEIAAELGIPPDVSPVSTSEFGARAQRPAYSVLATEKIKSTFGIEIPHWREGLVEALEPPLTAG